MVAFVVAQVLWLSAREEPLEEARDGGHASR